MISKSGLVYNPVIFQDGISEINLRSLICDNWNNLPWLVEARYCIYLITNLDNGKVYVGQATYLYGRFVLNGYWSHKQAIPFNEEYLYRSVRFHTARHFKVEILEKDCEDLNEREIYWINQFQSCVYTGKDLGYNLNYGGSDCSHLHTPEVNARRNATNAEIGGGDPYYMIHSKESFETNKKNHGGVLAFNTPESKAKSLATRAAKWNGDTVGHCHTKEMYDRLRREHGGILPINTEESKLKREATNAKLYNGDSYGQIHTENARLNQGKSRVIKSIYSRINWLIEEDSLDIESYIYKGTYHGSGWKHLRGVFGYFPYFIVGEDIDQCYYDMFKEIYKYCMERWPEWTLSEFGKIEV